MARRKDQGGRGAGAFGAAGEGADGAHAGKALREIHLPHPLRRGRGQVIGAAALPFLLLAPCGCESPSEKSTCLAEDILHISRLAHKRILGTEFAPRDYLDEFDRICAECEKRLRGKRRGRELVEAVNGFFFDEMGLSAEPDEDRVGHFFLDSVLDTRKGPCLALSGLYLAVAERLGLPFFGVVVPGHFFVRYDDGRVRVNVETLKGGVSMEDDWYRRKYRVPPGNSCYLRNLTPKETLAPYYFNLGNAYRASGRLDEAIEAYGRAVAFLPGFAEAHGNLGVAYLKKGETGKALSEFKKAIEENPLLAGAYLDLGAAYQAGGRLTEAVGAYRKGLAVAPAPGTPELHHALGTAYHRRGRLSEAAAAYGKAVAIRPDFARAHLDLAAVLERLGEHELARRHIRMAKAQPSKAATSGSE